MSDPVEFEAGAATYSVSLPQFEGPLDLLLHLCQKHELDILDIPIGFVTKKYLEYLAVMTHMQLDIAAEYLLMAATLAHIKSKMLLPLPPPGQEDDTLAEEEEDPREALIRRLLEYQKYKLAAAELEAKGIAAQNVFLRGASLEPEGEPSLPPLAEIPLFRLIEAFQGVLAKSKVKLGHDIVADRISITDRIHELLAILETRRQVVFEELFEGLVSKFDIVITFLALLEMTRLRMTRLFQTEAYSPLYVEYRAAAGDPLPEGLEAKTPERPRPGAPAPAPTAPAPDALVEPAAGPAVEQEFAEADLELEPDETELEADRELAADLGLVTDEPGFHEPDQVLTDAESDLAESELGEELAESDVDDDATSASQPPPADDAPQPLADTEVEAPDPAPDALPDPKPSAELPEEAAEPDVLSLPEIPEAPETDASDPAPDAIPDPDPDPIPGPDPIPDPIPDPGPDPIPDPIPDPGPDPIPAPNPIPEVPETLPAPAPSAPIPESPAPAPPTSEPELSDTSNDQAPIPLAGEPPIGASSSPEGHEPDAQAHHDEDSQEGPIR